MKIHELRQPEGATRPRKRVGRGIAAGQGKTAGRGTKGQNARSGNSGQLYREGGQLPLVRRLPFRRGQGFSNFSRVEYEIVNVEELTRFEAGTVVDRDLLRKVGLVKHEASLIKVLGRGDLDRALTVRVDKVSGSARAKIEATGGQVEAE